ncbi:Protein N-acetyltransferase, RimJ/RimL family [Meinhardsimonia xiamenensis]|jgi:RimJ/RimL family protein N-acetyltransferase|uniref:Protein N-acetyltransferase, RimJ/RimL family n=1 Tax=Meinhardsimonia xiamenensis TaxID=990712 RepID=A0A1G9EG52_9RHOB|nr:GNAT family N-acetyltransferase [Meinhardsimonia xiamenensis]PRX33782.1 RimJ/RimL family protein N-acetyltransferase [Meinhardsimonia xiamenensis]SDK75122.1 Protein N-acetyltransferase, RimJ/RimL family [Meinhardsimonia xiamenensis]
MIPRHEMPPAGSAAALAETIAAAIPVLETERTRLRAPRIGDFDLYASIVCSPRGSHLGGPYTRADAWSDFSRAVAGWLLHGHGLWCVETRADRLAIGFVVIGLEPGDAEPELGFLFAREVEGKGFAREAAAAARDFAWHRLGLESLVSYIDAENTRAIELALRLGARRDAAAEARLAEPACVYRHPRPEKRP